MTQTTVENIKRAHESTKDRANRLARVQDKLKVRGITRAVVAGEAGEALARELGIGEVIQHPTYTEMLGALTSDDTIAIYPICTVDNQDLPFDSTGKTMLKTWKDLGNASIGQLDNYSSVPPTKDKILISGV